MANQDYTVAYSTLAAPFTFINLATVAYDPFSTSGGDASSSLVTLSNLGAVGVSAVQFTFNEDTNNTGAGDAGSVIRELEVNGTPTLGSIPEASTYAMIFGGFGMLALVSRLRGKLAA